MIRCITRISHAELAVTIWHCRPFAAVALVFAIAGSACHFFERQRAVPAAEEERLNDRKYWPKQSLQPVANPDAYLVTRWFFGRAYFNLRIDAYSRKLEKMKVLPDAHLILTFLNVDGAVQFEERVRIRDLVTFLKPAGENPGGYRWEHNSLLPANSYRDAAGMRISWANIR
jgi:hypothetical protein